MPLLLSFCLSLSLSLFRIDRVAACWISALPCFPLFFLRTWRSKAQRLPASNSRWRAATDYQQAKLSLIPRKHCSCRSSFLLSFLPTCDEGKHRSDTFFLVDFNVFFWSQPRPVHRAPGSELWVSTPFFSFTRSAVTLSVTLRISPSLFLGFHNASGSHSKARVDFIPLLSTLVLSATSAWINRLGSWK